MKQKKGIGRIILYGFLISFLLWIFTDLFLSNLTLSVARYRYETDKLTSPVRIVLLTDLHHSRFGRDNVRLTRKVREEQPDLIFLTGDMLDETVKSTDELTGLISCLKEIAPVYFSCGNHELGWMKKRGVDMAEFTAAIEVAGAEVLDMSWKDITVNGQEIRVGGLYGYCLPEKYLHSGEADPFECSFLNQFRQTERLTVLSTHMPVCWVLNDSLNEWDIDLVLSGHNHAGQIRLPFVGAVYVPDMSWFPRETYGTFVSSDGEKMLVVSRGLGGSFGIPRFHNRPEIVTVQAEPAK